VASYSHFLGSTVKVQYRLGDVLLSASGTFVGDSGRSVFLEQHVEQRGRLSYFRWEIPYPYIHRIQPLTDSPEPDKPAEPEPSQPKAAAASAGAGDPTSSASSVLPLSQQRHIA